MMENKVLSLLQPLEAKPLSILCIIPLLFLFILSRLLRKRYPPGPKGWPVIGNMGMMGQLTHRGLAELAKQYGGIVHLRMGFLHMFAISGPGPAREVLQLHDNIFSDRPANHAITYLTYDRADMAFANYGPFWRQMRKLCVVKLFSRKRAESWDSARDEVDHMVRALGLSAGEPVNVGELVFGLTRNIIYRAAFGSSSHEGQDEFISILQEFSKLFGAFNIADFVPWLNFMDIQGLNARLAKARDSLDGFIDNIIDEHIQNKKKLNDESGDTDMVDELLAFYSEEDKISEPEELQSSIKLTRNNIKAIIMHADAVSGLAVNGDRGELYSMSWDKSCKTWKTSSDMACIDYVGSAHSDAVNAVASSGGTVYTGSAAGKIKVWRASASGDRRKQSLKTTLSKHDSSVNALALTPDGAGLASSGGVTLVWERRDDDGDDEEMDFYVACCLKGHKGAVLSLVCVSDGFVTR
ncbi:hypothetical protein SASPL_138056 [Salvia splendens]|uniref:Ferulate-5-hydroxylase n=1 Tax=Salvia splendens TaxID=180675 RepID=A0A8X8ZDZ1_SALSN|nr:hypothetical protein SASPL_138056 [Salvia splendens]